MGRILGGILLVLLCLISCEEKSNAQEIEAQNLVLTKLDVHDTLAYKFYLKQPYSDYSEIYYLIYLVKDSPYHFDKSGKLYDGSSASVILKHVFSKEQKSIASTESFIEKLSGYIDDGGESCEVVYPDGSSAPAKEVLYYELARLREHEKNRRTLALAGEDGQIAIALHVVQ